MLCKGQPFRLSGILAATLEQQRAAQGAGTTEDLLEGWGPVQSRAEHGSKHERPAFGAALCLSLGGGGGGLLLRLIPFRIEPQDLFVFGLLFLFDLCQ